MIKSKQQTTITTVTDLTNTQLTKPTSNAKQSTVSVWPALVAAGAVLAGAVALSRTGEIKPIEPTKETVIEIASRFTEGKTPDPLPWWPYLNSYGVEFLFDNNTIGEFIDALPASKFKSKVTDLRDKLNKLGSDCGMFDWDFDVNDQYYLTHSNKKTDFIRITFLSDNFIKAHPNAILKRESNEEAKHISCEDMMDAVQEVLKEKGLPSNYMGKSNAKS